MANILKFAQRNELQNQPPVRGEADIARMVASVLGAQLAAKRAIVIALYEMELTLVRCRAAVERISDNNSEKQKFESHIRAIEHAMMVAQAVAASF